MKVGQRSIAGALAAVVVVVATLILARSYLPIPCTVGASGTALNVTADGWGAGKACETMMNTVSSSVNGFAPYSTNPFGQVVCVVPLGNIRYTVRDTGLLDLFGNAVCQYLQQQTPAAQAAASAAADASAAATSASASAEAQAQLRQEQDAINQAAEAVRTDINALNAAADITGSEKDAPAVLKAAQADLNTTYAAKQSAASCTDAYSVRADAYTVQSDAYSMQAVKYSEQAATSGINNQISGLDGDWAKLQAAVAALPGYVVATPTFDQVQNAEQSANGAMAQGDKTMADYLAKLQTLVSQANAYADAAAQQHC